MPRASIETKIQGKPVKLAVETAYPFRDEIDDLGHRRPSQ